MASSVSTLQLNFIILSSCLFVLGLLSIQIYTKKDFSTNCQDNDIAVKLSKGQKNCIVEKKEIGPGEKLIWKDDALNNCRYFDMDNFVKVSVEAAHNGKFCPLLLNVELDDSDITQFRAQFENIHYDTSTNEKLHKVTKFWPEGKFYTIAQSYIQQVL